MTLERRAHLVALTRQSLKPVARTRTKLSSPERFLSGAAIATMTLCINAIVANAQDIREEDKKPRVAATQTEAAVSGEATVLEAITVQARRYSENPLDVPVSISVVSGEKLARDHIEVVDDLSKTVIGLQQPNYGDDPRTAQPIIRGIGTLSTLLSPDNSTAPTIIDGVPMPAFAATSQLLDVGQVEVLRGPQGTLFGRNSTAGAINVMSVVPDGETFRQVTGEIGTNHYGKVEGILGGAITEDLYGRFAIRYNRDGDYLKNDHPGQSDIGSLDVGAAKSSFLWNAGDGTEVNLSVGYEKSNSDTGYPYRLRDTNVYQETPTFQRELVYTSLNVSHEFENFVLKSTTGFTYYDIYNWTDNSDGYINSATFGAFGLTIPPETYTYDGEANITNQRESQIYQEVRLQSLEGADTRWVIGGVVSHNDFNENAVGTSNSAASINGTRYVNLTTTSTAIYGDIAQPFAERWEVGAGLRYTHDRKGIDQLYTGNGFPGTVASYSQDASRNFDMVSGRMSLSYKVTDDMLLYGSVSRGTKSGGFPRFTGNAAIGQPEKGYDETSVWAYETGVKAEVLDGTTIAVAGFYNDVKDEAIFGFDPVTSTFPIENFDLETYGFEAEVTTELAYGFSLSGGVAFTKSEITGIPANGVLAAAVGNEVPNVPLWSGNIAINYLAPADFLNISGDPELSGTLAYHYVGKRQADTANSFELEAQHVVDARVGLKVNETEFYVFGKNLIGDLLEQQGAHIVAGVDSVVVSRGRTVGIGVTTKF